MKTSSTAQEKFNRSILSVFFVDIITQRLFTRIVFDLVTTVIGFSSRNLG